MSAFAIETLGEPMVYPGHALVFAYLALVKYGEPAKAIERAPGSEYPRCVADPDLPGAGDGAWAGHDLLLDLLDGRTPSDLVHTAAVEWQHRCGPGTSSHERYFAEGCAQAARIRDAFVVLAARLMATHS